MVNERKCGQCSCLVSQDVHCSHFCFLFECLHILTFCSSLCFSLPCLIPSSLHYLFSLFSFSSLPIQKSTIYAFYLMFPPLLSLKKSGDTRQVQGLVVEITARTPTAHNCAWVQFLAPLLILASCQSRLREAATNTSSSCLPIIYEKTGIGFLATLKLLGPKTANWGVDQYLGKCSHSCSLFPSSPLK